MGAQKTVELIKTSKEVSGHSPLIPLYQLAEECSESGSELFSLNIDYTMQGLQNQLYSGNANIG